MTRTSVGGAGNCEAHVVSSENEVTAEALELWTICLPRSGPPSREPIQGTPVLSFSVAVSQGDDLEASLRKLTPSLRRGRPMIYRGGRELLPDKLDADEERELTIRAASQDPAEAAAAHEALQLRELRRQLGLDLDLKRRELEALNGRISGAAAQLAADLERNRKLVADAMDHNQKLVADAQTHYEARLRNTWKVEADLEQHSTDGLQRLGTQVEIATNAKKQIDRVMRGATAAEFLTSFKENIEAGLNSPVGQAIGAGIAARIAATVSNRMTKEKPGERKVEADDVLAGFVLQGRAIRDRRQGLQEIRTAAGAESTLAEALVLGADFILGTVEVRVVGEFLSRRR